VSEAGLGGCRDGSERSGWLSGINSRRPRSGRVTEGYWVLLRLSQSLSCQEQEGKCCVRRSGECGWCPEAAYGGFRLVCTLGAVQLLAGDCRKEQ
jgi:hypothetical protein